MRATATETRLAIAVAGVVQGIGFRPFVFGLAKRLALKGFVRNNNGLVEIEVQGQKDAIADFLRELTDRPPPLAHISRIATTSRRLGSETGFSIVESAFDVSGHKCVPPDAATCADCLEELFDPDDRRFRYPFINCTNCGPRFTIIRSLPYDRHATTMTSFAMCLACREEFEDPQHRRFHAQPNACPDCGPTLSLRGAHSRSENLLNGEDAIQGMIKRLESSEIVAVKGLGGFHLVCDAHDRTAIQKLRERKNRLRKPFALMMTDLEMVRSYCKLSPQEEEALLHPSSPIVLLEKLPGSLIADEVAPGVDRLGVMLPYTPLNHLIMRDYARPLVATSGNSSEEPIAIDNKEARARLSDIADAFLIHNRDICSRYDDSVIHIVSGKRAVLRRSRGLAPLPFKLPFRATRNVLAFGGHLKNTFCLVKGDQAFVSQHIGNLENIETDAHFKDTLDTYIGLFDIAPEVVAHDLHPDYLSTAAAISFARANDLPVFAVQHHHAHIVSCMAEHSLANRVIGVAFDGLGLGDDETLWGGEFLLSDLKSYERVAHFEPVPMPGGIKAIHEPWRMALSYILNSQDAGGQDFLPFRDSLANSYGRLALEVVGKQIINRINAPVTSSCGRFFDAMAALLGVCQRADYEGQAAIELEALAHRYMVGEREEQDFSCGNSYPYEICDSSPHVIKQGSVLAAAYEEFLRGISASEIACKFHMTVAMIILDVCSRLRDKTGINTICLGGGVFQNRLLLSLALKSLSEAGFTTYFPRELPANDGGLSFGQAVVALANAGAFSVDRTVSAFTNSGAITRR